LFQPGKGVVPDGYFYWPSLVVTPRFGAAYDLKGDQKLVIRGGGGWFADRTSAGTCNICSNPPSSVQTTSRFGQLQNFGKSGLNVAGAASIVAFNLHQGLPQSFQWNGGVQMALPWSTALDVEYAGQHSWDSNQTFALNGIDLGTAFLQSMQDPTVAAS